MIFNFSQSGIIKSRLFTSKISLELALRDLIMGTYDEATWNIGRESDNPMKPLPRGVHKARPETLDGSLDKVVNEFALTGKTQLASSTQPPQDQIWRPHSIYQTDFLDLLSRKAHREEISQELHATSANKDLLDLNNLSSQSASSIPPVVDRRYEAPKLSSTPGFSQGSATSAQHNMVHARSSQIDSAEELQNFKGDIANPSDEDAVDDSEGEIEILTLSSQEVIRLQSSPREFIQQGSQKTNHITNSQADPNSNYPMAEYTETQMSNINFQSEDLSLSCNDLGICDTSDGLRRPSQVVDYSERAFVSSIDMNSVQEEPSIQNEDPTFNCRSFDNTNETNDNKISTNRDNLIVIENEKENIKINGDDASAKRVISNSIVSSKIASKSQTRRRAAALADLCSKTNFSNTRLRVGLSKRNRIDPLHRNLKR